MITVTWDSSGSYLSTGDSGGSKHFLVRTKLGPCGYYLVRKAARLGIGSNGVLPGGDLQPPCDVSLGVKAQREYSRPRMSENATYKEFERSKTKNGQSRLDKGGG